MNDDEDEEVRFGCCTHCVPCKGVGGVGWSVRHHHKVERVDDTPRGGVVVVIVVVVPVRATKRFITQRIMA